MGFHRIKHVSTTGDDNSHQEAIDLVISNLPSNSDLKGLYHSASISGDPRTGPYILHSTIIHYRTY
jgi:hypothetical protein